MAVAPFTHDDYTFAWICPLEVEQIAALAMLDEQHPPLPQPRSDSNSYILGSIQGHNVVIASLPNPGNCPAATVVTNARRTFQQLKAGLLVGTGGGVPTRTDAGLIKLGHIVVSKPTGTHSGAVQYDHGKAEVGHFRRTGCLPPPPYVLLNVAQKVAVRLARYQEDPLEKNLQRIDVSRPWMARYRYPGPNKDHVFEADYAHSDQTLSCQDCKCDMTKIVDRYQEDPDSDVEDDAGCTERRIVVHRGTIAAGEKVIRDGVLRDQLAKDGDVLCFETEAAGALQDFPCLVIRGISNYADSHKNGEWQGYAAAVAAAYARELFVDMPLYQGKPRQTTENGQYNTQLLYAVTSDDNDEYCPPDKREMVANKLLIVQSTSENQSASRLHPLNRSTNYDYTHQAD